MDRLLEAQKNYKRNGDKQALFETAYTSRIKINEALEYLGDTIGSTFDREEYGEFLDKKYAKKIKGTSSTDILDKGFWGE